MTVNIRQITEADIEGFHTALDIVARERKYLTFLEAPPLEQTAAFVRRNIAEGYPQLVVLDNNEVVGWCDVTRPDRPVMAHVGVLGMGLLPTYRGRGLGQQLMTEALAAAKAAGFSRVQLGVLASNHRAAALYRKMRFVEEV